MTDKTRVRIAHNAAIFLVFLLLSVLLTWPAVAHLTDRVMGSYPGDNFHFLWELWYVAHSVFDLHKTPFFDPDIFVPYGFDLIKNQDLSPGTVLLFMPLTRLVGEVATYNLLIISSFFLTAYGTFLLAYELWKSRWGAFLAAVSVAFCAYRYTHSGGHLSIVTTQWIPFFFLYLEKTIRRPTVTRGALTGLFYSLCAWATWYYGWTVPIAALLYLLVRVDWRSGREQLSCLFRAGVVAVTISLLLVLPFAIPYALATTSGAMSPRSIGETQSFAASLADYVIPPIQHPVWGSWIAQHWRAGANGQWLSEWQLYLGLLTIALACIGAFKAPRRRMVWSLLVLAFACLLLSLGPTLYITHPKTIPETNLSPLSSIPLPVLLLNKFPPFSFLRAWARMGFFVELSAALLGAGGLSYVMGKLRRRRTVWRPVIGLAITCLALFDLLAIPCGMSPIVGRSVDRWLARQPGRSVIMEFPIPNNGYSGPAMYSTRLTGKRIAMGYASYPPNTRYFPILAAFPSSETLDLLENWGVDYVLVDEKLYQGGSEFWQLWQTWRSLEPAIWESGRLKEVTTLGGIHVYELHGRKIQPVSEELVPNSGFESGTVAEMQGWTRVGHPIIDRSGKEAHGGSSSCSVTASDYLVSNPIPIESGRCYALQLSARRAKSRTALARLQIMWLDALQHPLDPSSTGIRVVEASEQWRSAHGEFLAPVESRYAIIYAVAHSGAVWLDDYSFREVSSACEPSLIAIPNPAVQPPGAKRSRISISWDSHSGAGSHLGVLINGRPETRFSEGAVGMRIFDIETDSRCEFRLYRDTDGAPVKMTIVTSEGIAPLHASPVIFPSRAAPGTTTVSWNMPGQAEADVWVSQDGGPEHLFARGARGSQEAPWIARGSTYEFRLYALLPERQLIGKVAVRETGSSP